ncbi:MAG: hypothetical protein EOP45_19830 [Sphingobacteriaceae bacterium]|nr:MAG: hypothetical protein EOP45_19830 [Sphingobacteriaceae bacterium]
MSRKLGFIAPEELALAVLTVVRDSFALERDAVALLATRLLGFSRPSENQRQAFSKTIDQLLSECQLQESNGVLTPA